MAEHHDEGHQRTPCAADLKMAEVTPVHLRLFARQATQTQIGFGFRARPMAGDQVAEVIGAAAIAAFAHHSIQPAGRQRRERLQRLADERQIRVDLRSAGGGPILGNPACASTRVAPRCDARATDAAMVPMRPLLDVVIAQDLRLDIRRCHHGRVPSGRVAWSRRRPRRRRNPWRTRSGQRRPHQWQCEAGRRRSFIARFAPLAIVGEPGGTRSSDGGAG